MPFYWHYSIWNYKHNTQGPLIFLAGRTIFIIEKASGSKALGMCMNWVPAGNSLGEARGCTATSPVALLPGRLTNVRSITGWGHMVLENEVTLATPIIRHGYCCSNAYGDIHVHVTHCNIHWILNTCTQIRELSKWFWQYF